MKIITKDRIIGAIAGAIILATTYLGYVFYQEISIVQNDHITLANVVCLINTGTLCNGQKPQPITPIK